MDTSLLPACLLTAVVGLVLGLFGGGGSVLAVPVLVYAAHFAPATAAGLSLSIVGLTSLVASYGHYRRGHVHLPTALTFGGAGLAAAFLGARLSHLVSGDVLMLGFAALMIVVGAAMTLSREPRAHEAAVPSWHHRSGRALLAGAVVGLLTGFLGVGGGFLVVPALVALTGLRLRDAVGTSLLIIAMNSAAGFLGHLGSDIPPFGLIAGFTAMAMGGAWIGGRLGRRLPAHRLRLSFAAFIVLVGIAVAVATLVGR